MVSAREKKQQNRMLLSQLSGTTTNDFLLGIQALALRTIMLLTET